MRRVSKRFKAGGAGGAYPLHAGRYRRTWWGSVSTASPTVMCMPTALPRPGATTALTPVTGPVTVPARGCAVGGTASEVGHRTTLRAHVARRVAVGPLPAAAARAPTRLPHVQLPQVVSRPFPRSASRPLRSTMRRRWSSRLGSLLTTHRQARRARLRWLLARTPGRLAICPWSAPRLRAHHDASHVRYGGVLRSRLLHRGRRLGRAFSAWWSSSGRLPSRQPKTNCRLPCSPWSWVPGRWSPLPWCWTACGTTSTSPRTSSRFAARDRTISSSVSAAARILSVCWLPHRRPARLSLCAGGVGVD